MRDFERLEELSSTVQSGLRSNDVIWAIDQALAGENLDESTRQSLRSGRDILNEWSEIGAVTEPNDGRHSQSMLGSEGRASARNLIISVAQPEGDNDEASEVLGELANSLDAVSTGEPAAEHKQSLESALEVFSMISEIKLGQANGIVRARRERTPWLPRTTISTSF